MNRTVKGLALATVVTVGAVAPATGAPRSRTETAAYERASGAHLTDVAWLEIAAGDLPTAQPLAREKSVSITLEDESGRPIAAVVHQGDNELGELCGQTEAPLTLSGRAAVHVHVYSGPGCADVSLPTSGTVTFTFTR